MNIGIFCTLYKMSQHLGDLNNIVFPPHFVLLETNLLECGSAVLGVNFVVNTATLEVVIILFTAGLLAPWLKASCVHLQDSLM